MIKYSSKNNRAISVWLFILTIMTFLMIVIGGLTRLTDSGLSMVDWRPIMGTIPPLNYSDWVNAFDAYKTSPEYKIINKSINLEQFKYIFLWEWSHRFFARFLGIAFLIPLCIFLIQKKISKPIFLSLILVFVFGLFQAVVGWWMVKSGLNNNPYVSQYRLAFHLINAIIILNILLWISMNSTTLKKRNFLPQNKIEVYFLLIIFLLFITIISGAFMAGTNAGQSFNTFPLMNGYIIPEDYFIGDYGFLNFFENTVTINFNHRWLATFTFIIIIIFATYIYLSNSKKLYFEASLIFLFACLQFFLGIAALLTNVNIILASMHQVNSVLLLASLLFAYHKIKKLEVL